MKQNINTDLNADQGIFATAEDVETMSTLEGAELTSSLMLSPTSRHSSSSIMTPSISLSPKVDEDENAEKLQMDPNSSINPSSIVNDMVKDNMELEEEMFHVLEINPLPTVELLSEDNRRKRKVIQIEGSGNDFHELLSEQEDNRRKRKVIQIEGSGNDFHELLSKQEDNRRKRKVIQIEGSG